MFMIIEMQTDANGNIAEIITKKATQAEAEADFHRILAAAAVSSVPVHSAVILTDNGYALRREFYDHRQQPEPNAEPAE